MSIVKSPDEVNEAFHFAAGYDSSGRVLVEERHQGNEHSVELYIRNGIAHVLAISDKIKTSPRTGSTRVSTTLEGGQLIA